MVHSVHIGNDGIECVQAKETSDDMYRPQRALIGILIQHPDNEISIIEEISQSWMLVMINGLAKFLGKVIPDDA